MNLKNTHTKNKLKSSKAITLIALIITVIVMLILAGVSISVLTGGGGLFEKTTSAVEKYNQAAKNENDTMQECINQLDGYSSGPIINTPKATVVASNVAQTTFTLTSTAANETSIQKYEFYIDGILEDTVTTSTTTATFDVTGKIADRTYTCKVKVYDSDNNALESAEIIVNTLSASLTVAVLNTDKNQTLNGLTTGTYNNPLIPKGFKAVETAQDPTITTGAKWGTADGYKYGLVIQDNDGNQFVWVPVDGKIVTYARCNWNNRGVTYDSYSEKAPAINNGGFYIARYEAGNEQNTLVSKANATVYNTINWSNSKIESEKMYSGDTYGVISTLIYGTQWDTALKFISAYNVGEIGFDTYPTNSNGMGNYQGEAGGDTITENLATCGALEAFRQKNIYDMAGNVWEMTMESNSSSAILRGGCGANSGSIVSASYRFAISVESKFGFRVALYIK